MGLWSLHEIFQPYLRLGLVLGVDCCGRFAFVPGRLELCSCLWWLQWASLLLQQAICFAFFVRSCSVFSTKDDTSRGPLIKSSEHGPHVALGAISNPTAAPPLWDRVLRHSCTFVGVVLSCPAHVPILPHLSGSARL